MMADVWFGRESCVFTLLACLQLLLHPHPWLLLLLLFSMYNQYYILSLIFLLQPPKLALAGLPAPSSCGLL